MRSPPLLRNKLTSKAAEPYVVNCVMGLTIHYKMEAAAETDAAQARSIVSCGNIVAQGMQERQELDEVGPVTSDWRALKLAAEYRAFPIPGRKGSFVQETIRPAEGFMFRALVGRDCEPLWLGLCRYPAEVATVLGWRQTRLGGRWQFSGFSKTQYASLHGWEHFLRCHRAIIDVLAAWRELGLAVRISDEGGYWPRRSERTLRRNLEEMNGAIAAAAGALKDQSEAHGGQAGVLAPIFRHRDFERLEAEGAKRARKRGRDRARGRSQS